jgi:polyphenol oxidase
VFVLREALDGDLDHPVVEVAFTDATVDVAERPDTDLDRLVGELVRLEAACGVAVSRMHQVHGTDVEVVGAAARGPEPGRVRGAPAPPDADGLVTREPGVALMTRAADCVPVLLADAEAGVVGAVHAGRAGVSGGVVPATLRRMRELGARHVTAWVGPHICGRCYEVPAEMRAEVAAAVPETWAETSWGTPALDLGAGVRAQLDADGVVHSSVDRCTREDDELWSHRRDGAAAGRLAGLVWMRP